MYPGLNVHVKNSCLQFDLHERIKDNGMREKVAEIKKPGNHRNYEKRIGQEIQKNQVFEVVQFTVAIFDHEFLH